jgi:hypothetical protein
VREDINRSVYDGLLLAGVAPGLALTQMTYVVVKYGVVELLGGAPRTIEEIARETGTHEPTLRRLVRALTAYGFFAKDAEGRFSLTTSSRRLLRDAPDSLRAPLLGLGSAWAAWNELSHSIRTGECAFEHAKGMRDWDHLKDDPEAVREFNAHMGAIVREKVDATAATYPFPETGVVVDVGGNDGALLGAVLQRRPNLRGVLFDQPHIVAAAEGRLGAAGVLPRCTIVTGSFFEEVPAGGDLYMLSSVLHDWSDDEAKKILERVRAAMKPGAKLLLVEMVLPDDETWSLAFLLDINMLVVTGGRERTRSDWKSVLASGGFTISDFTPARDFSLITAVPT